MKNTKKKVFVVALAICLVAIISMGSLAWFTASDSVDNTFKIADSNDDANDVFSIDLYEKKDTDGDGVGDTRTDYGIVYGDNNEVVPGADLCKEAYVENTGKYYQYVRIKVTLSDVTEWKTVLGITSLTEFVDLTAFFDVANDFDTTWYRNDAETVYDATEDTLTYVYYYNDVLEADAAAVSFINGVSIPETMTREDAVAMDGSFTLTFVAEAIQSTDMLDTYGTVEYQNAIDSFAAA